MHNVPGAWPAPETDLPNRPASVRELSNYQARWDAEILLAVARETSRPVAELLAEAAEIIDSSDAELMARWEWPAETCHKVRDAVAALVEELRSNPVGAA